MEQTLGKRIAENRKRMGMTQDALAEKLGITAQAISKWENDQSCPDITTLPKLAEIFGMSIDALLGHKTEAKVHKAEVVEEQEDLSGGVHIDSDRWEFHWGSGRSGIGFACWVVLLGILLLVNNIFHLDVSFWGLLWPSGLLMMGLFSGKRFSFTQLGFVLLGGYFLVDNLGFMPAALGGEIIWPALVILFGISLFVDAIRKPKKSGFSWKNKEKAGDPSCKKGEPESSCTVNDGYFECHQSFGENTFCISEDLLSGGEAVLAFGSLTVDLTGCKLVAPNCKVEANCAFGEIKLQIPRCFRVELDSDTAFGAVNITGTPDPDVVGTIRLDASASFGEVCVHYV